MQIEDISCSYLEELNKAASQWVVGNDPHLILDLMSQLQQESIKEGYNRAIEILQDAVKENK